MSIFQQILDSSGFGIGLLDKSHELLYCNTALQAILNNPESTLVGGNIYTALTLTPQQADEISVQLKAKAVWEGVISWSEKAVKARISTIDFPPPSLSQPFESACFIIALSDYSDELRQQRELVEAKRLAEKSEKVKSEFLSNMTHELRTPLNAILGFSQLMEIDPDLSEEQQDNLQEITSASESLLKLVNETLELSRTEPGKLKFTNEVVYLKDIFAECVSLLGPLADKKNIVLRYQDCEATLAVDRIRLKQILLNLLSNAIKYNKPGGQVLIQSRLIVEDIIRIEVLDSGNGIAPKFINSIFSPFERFNLSHNKIANSGIGLMLTRRLVKMMQGQINVLSEPGAGSIFWFELPTGLAYANQPLPFSHAKNLLWLGSDTNHKLARHLSKIRPKLTFQQVENLAAMRKLAPTLPPDLIFLSIEENDSLAQQCEQLQSLLKLDNSLKEIPIIAVVNSISNSMLHNRESPATAEQITKPLSIIDFIEIIDRYLYT